MRASGYERHADDWYVEPAWAVDALIAAERRFAGPIIDPCCGRGTIVERLHASRSGPAFGSDRVDRASGRYPARDYESAFGLTEGWASVISNPPYGVAREFIDCALANTTDRVCVLLRLAFLEGIKRREWFKSVPLARVWVSSKRMSMPPGASDVPAKGGAIAYAWFVFEHGHSGPAQIRFLPDVASGASARVCHVSPEPQNGGIAR